MMSAPFVLSFYDLQNEKWRERGTFQVVDLLQNNPYQFSETPHYVKKYLDYPNNMCRSVGVWGVGFAGEGIVMWYPVDSLIIVSWMYT